jgi:hypothetical protein
MLFLQGAVVSYISHVPLAALEGCLPSLVEWPLKIQIASPLRFLQITRPLIRSGTLYDLGDIWNYDFTEYARRELENSGHTAWWTEHHSSSLEVAFWRKAIL